MDGVSIVIFTTQKMWMTKRTALKNRMLFRRISSVNRCRQKVLKEVSRKHPQPRKSLKRQRVRRSKVATRAQHSRAGPVAQIYTAELGKSNCRYHARVHFSCVICIAAAFQLLPLFIFSMFIFVYFFTQTDPTRTVQRSALCRSRRELSNAYLLAKIGVDTAENEPLEVWGENSIQYSLHSLGAPRFCVICKARMRVATKRMHNIGAN